MGTVKRTNYSEPHYCKDNYLETNCIPTCLISVARYDYLVAYLYEHRYSLSIRWPIYALFLLWACQSATHQRNTTARILSFKVGHIWEDSTTLFKLARSCWNQHGYSTYHIFCSIWLKILIKQFYIISFRILTITRDPSHKYVMLSGGTISYSGILNVCASTLYWYSRKQNDTVHEILILYRLRQGIGIASPFLHIEFVSSIY